MGVNLPRALYVLALVALVICQSCSEGHGPVAMRPNFVVVLTDDLDWKVMSRTLERGGALQRLADEGITYRNFFVVSPSCMPSRVTFLRGQYTHNHGIVSGAQPPGGFRQLRESGLERSTVATWLQAAGYRTIFIGKYANGQLWDDLSYVPPGWDEWYMSLSGHYYGFRVSENGTPVRYGCCEVYETDAQSGWAVDFIRRATEDSVPFFVYVAPFAPHVPPVPAIRHEGAFAGDSLPRVPNLNEDDVSDKPSFIAALPPLTEDQLANFDELYRQRLRTMLAVDEMVDSILKALEETGQRENTYVIFASDNGWHNGEHRLPRGKLTAYSEDINVPLIVAGPTVPDGAENDRLVLNTDFAPTIAELAGILPPGFVDGQSFAPSFSRFDFTSESRERFLVQWSRKDPLAPQQPDQYWDHAYRAVRSGSYLYVEWDNGEIELYDRLNDPYELENIAADASPELVFMLSSWLDGLRSCSGTGCRQAEGW